MWEVWGIREVLSEEVLSHTEIWATKRCYQGELEKRASCKVDTKERWAANALHRSSLKEGFAAPSIGSAGSPLGHCLSCREMHRPRSRTPRPLRWTISVAQHLSWVPEAVGLASQLAFSLFPLLLPPPPFHGCWFQGHSLINILNTKLHRSLLPGESKPHYNMQRLWRL